MKKIQSVIEIIFSFAVVIYLFLLFVAFIDWGFLKGEITDYPIQCQNKPVYGVCNKKDFALRKTTYKPSVQRQDVVYSTEGFDVKRLTKCAVKDRKNWTCTYDDESAEIGFTNGKFFEVSLKESKFVSEDMFDKIYYVPKHEWIRQSCRDSWINYYLCLLIINYLN